MSNSERYSCDTCPQTFETRGKCNRHIKRHTKPDQCPSCPRAFASQSDLNRHKQARHRVGNKKHMCAICHNEYSRKDNYIKHMRMAHPKNQIEKDINSAESTAALPNIWDAASTGNISLIQRLVSDGLEIDSAADDGSTMLHCAARAGHSNTAQFLLDQGAGNSRNAIDRSPLDEAVIGGNIDTFKTLLQVEIRTGNGPQWKDLLYKAVGAGSKDVTHLILTEFGMDHMIDLSLFHHAAKLGQQDMAQRLLDYPGLTVENRDKFGCGVIHYAAAYGHATLVKAILAKNRNEICSRLPKSGYYFRRASNATPIWLTASRGHDNVVELLLKYDEVDVPELSTVLPVIAKRGHSQVVRMLLAHESIDVNAGTHSTPLEEAASSGHTKIVQMLLAHESINVNAGTYSTPLEKAISSGHIEIVRMLLAHESINVNAGTYSTPLEKAISSGYTEIVRMLLDRIDINVNIGNGGRDTAFFEAVVMNRSEMVRQFLSHKQIDINQTYYAGNTALHVAVLTDRIEIVKFLLSHKPIDINRCNEAQKTALDIAISYKRLEMVKLLLDCENINVNVTSPGRYDESETCIHCAVDKDNFPLIELLFNYEKFEKDPRTTNNLSPLHIAVNNCSISVVALLAKCKDVDVNARILNTYRENSMRGKSAIELARSQGYHNIARLLLDNGAVEDGYGPSDVGLC
ncbi:ankyrin repeat-containing domain protein [Dendryphion nanum]|uniref:Ankyrin repeat-containing domain protein n=1 Tax=Dendryphion nanum TaxID=256645 RepID=A0A9P9DYE8_9PLEO|nr:ankyrin repeat-containing domain protein [Dendryphion nanum]